MQGKIFDPLENGEAIDCTCNCGRRIIFMRTTEQSIMIEIEYQPFRIERVILSEAQAKDIAQHILNLPNEKF